MEIQDGVHPRKYNFTYRPPNLNRQMMFNFFGHKGFHVNEEHAISCVPERLNMFLRVLYGGQVLLEHGCHDTEDQEENEKRESSEDFQHGRVLSAAQDLVYGCSGGKQWTPKHVGLASTLHQMTRSRQLVTLFHKADHIISYNDLLCVDTF